MVKEIDRAGIPVTHICTVVPISLTLGGESIVQDDGTPKPLGDPTLREKKSYEIRENLVMRGLKALTVPVEEQTVFEEDI